MASWSAAVRVERGTVRVVVMDLSGDEVLRARLPGRAEHPRALLTMLEGVSLYAGERLRVATSVAESVALDSGYGPLGEGLWPIGSALVRFDVVERPRARRRIAGVMDVRDLRWLLAHCRASGG